MHLCRANFYPEGITNSTFQIVPASTPEHWESVQLLLEEYWNSFGFTPCFQGFADELAGLPGAYSQHAGGNLALAVTGDSGGVAGCIAFRRVDEARCEAKRLYVRPGYRGRGIAQSLLDWLMQEAKAAGYRAVVCDTIAGSMQSALALYERNGFTRIEPYLPNPTAGAICLGRDLLLR